jgi:hypothetical protein
MADDDRIAALQRELDALKRKIEPPQPFTPQPFQRYDPTAGMSMPRSALEAMFMPDRMVQDIVREQRVSSVTQGPSADGTTGTVSAVHTSSGLPGSHRGTGWVEPRPMGPPPGVAAADRLMDAQDARDRAELIVQEARTAAVRKAIAETK